MESFILSNVSIWGIMNFAGRGKCSTPAVNGDSVCYTRAYRYLHVADFLMDVLEPLLPRPLLVVILFRGLVRIMLPGVASFSFAIHFSTKVKVLLFSSNRVFVFSGLSCLLGRRICLVSCSHSFSKCWLVTRTASTSSVLA